MAFADKRPQVGCRLGKMIRLLLRYLRMRMEGRDGCEWVGGTIAIGTR